MRDFHLSAIIAARRDCYQVCVLNLCVKLLVFFFFLRGDAEGGRAPLRERHLPNLEAMAVAAWNVRETGENGSLLLVVPRAVSVIPLQGRGTNTMCVSNYYRSQRCSSGACKPIVETNPSHGHRMLY